MIVAVLTLISIVIPLLRGGRLIRLANVPFRYAFLVIISLIFRLIINSAWWNEHGTRSWTPWLMATTLFILVVWFSINRQLPGMIILGAGLLLNLIVIIANGGYMPASPAALEIAGLDYRIADPNQYIEGHSIVASESTRLYYLADIFAIPESWPRSFVFSIGDVLLALGGFYFLNKVLMDERLDPVEET